MIHLLTFTSTELEEPQRVADRINAVGHALHSANLMSNMGIEAVGDRLIVLFSVTEQVPGDAVVDPRTGAAVMNPQTGQIVRGPPSMKPCSAIRLRAIIAGAGNAPDTLEPGDDDLVNS